MEQITSQLTRKDFEIMAPVGSYDSLYAAIRGGANSVYFGIRGLNMRAHSSKSFSTEDLEKIVEICRPHGIATYLTVNTIIYDGDMNFLYEIIDAAKRAGITAIIASDVAAMAYAHAQGVEVHLSTQLNITNTEALRFYARYADVVVLARELTLEQVHQIYKAIVTEKIRGPKGELIRIEMFCHGALCMAVSGKCYLSLHEAAASANRGACHQICRRQYIVKDKETDIEMEIDNSYILSPKDLKTIHFLNKMMDAGVRVFKIEGRARGPEYVRTTCECYDEALRCALAEGLSEEKIAVWNERLARVFNRGFWDGYYLGKRLGEWTHLYGSSATRVKTNLGRVLKYFSRLSVAEIEVESGYIERGEEIVVTGPTTGAVLFDVEEMRVENQQQERITKGERFSIRVPERIRQGDRVFVMREKKSPTKF